MKCDSTSYFLVISIMYLVNTYSSPCLRGVDDFPNPVFNKYKEFQVEKKIILKKHNKIKLCHIERWPHLTSWTF